MAPHCVPRRYTVIGLCFVGMLLGRALKTNLDYTTNLAAYGDTDSTESSRPVTWDEGMLQYLGALYFVGFLCTQIPAGYLSTRMPSHFLLSLGMLGTCVCNLLLPLSIAKDAYIWTCLLRVMMGMAEGFLLPAYYGTLWRWTHRYERGKLGSLVISGYFLGSLLGLPLSGLLARTCGWMYSYCVFSAVGLLWVIAWAFLGNERPETDPNISDTELEHLRQESRYDVYNGRPLSVPWKEILTSKHVLVLCLCNFTFYMSYTNEPHYVRAFGHGFSYYYRVLCACLPQIALVLVAHIAGFISDGLVRSDRLTITVVRKIFTCLGFSIEGLCFLCLDLVTEPTASLVLLTIGIGASGLTTSGWQINHLDLAPRFCGLLVGMSGTCGALASLICLLVADLVPADLSANRNFFPLVAAMTGAAAIAYGLLGTGEVQPWSDEPQKQGQRIAVVLPGERWIEGRRPDVTYRAWPFYPGAQEAVAQVADSSEEEEEADDTQQLLHMCER